LVDNALENNTLKIVIADGAYDSKENFRYLYDNNIEAASSLSFGHREIRDAFYGVINMTCLLHPQKGVDINSCEHTNQGNQSIDILAVDCFSGGRFLNATLWLVSPIKETASNSQDTTNYGMFIDADDNPKTGWQAIDHQVEDSRNNGNWIRTFYEFSSVGDTRVLSKRTIQISMNKMESISHYMQIWVPWASQINIG
jgi:hypothetical protein